MGMIALLLQLFFPLLVVIFFAVSPMQFFMGHRAVVGSETTSHSFICPMGIEWQGGSEKYLKILGQDHSKHINHHDMHHDDDNNKPTQETPEPCPIEKTILIVKQFTDNTMNFNSLLLFIIFILLLIIPQKRFLHLLKQCLLYITPPRHAPPVLVY